MPALREILAEFGFKFDEQKVNRADAAVNGLVARVKELVGPAVLGAVAVGLSKMTFALAEQADALAKQSAAIGLSAEELQAWQHAAGLSGVQASEFTAALGKLQKKAADAAASTTGPGAQAFQALGVEIKNADGSLRSLTDLRDGVADGMAKIQNPTERTAIAMALFEETGPRFINLFSQGSEAMRAMRAEVAALGGGITNDFARASEAMNDQLSRLRLLSLSLKVTLAQALLPTIRAIVDKMVQWGKALAPLVQNTKIVEAALTSLGLLGGRAIFGLLGKFGGLKAVLRAVLPLLMRFLLPLLLIEDLFVFLAGGDSLIGRSLDKAFGAGTAGKIQKFWKGLNGDSANTFDQMREEAKAHGGFWGDYMADLATVAQVAWNAITGGWEVAAEQLAIVGQGIMLALKIVWTEVSGAAAEAGASIIDTFAGAWNSIVSGAQSALNWIAKVMGAVPGLGSAAEGIRKLATGLESDKADADSGELVRRGIEIERLQLANEFDKISARQSQLNDLIRSREAAGNGMTVNNTVNQTITAGTPDAISRAAASGAQKGTQRGIDTAGLKAALGAGAG